MRGSPTLCLRYDRAHGYGGARRRLLPTHRQRRGSGDARWDAARLGAAAARAGVPVGFYGGARDVLEKLVAAARERFPGLRIVYAWSPPFRKITPEEDTAVVEEINRSEARILFVGLGCPKQDRWMAAH